MLRGSIGGEGRLEGESGEAGFNGVLREGPPEEDGMSHEVQEGRE